MADSTPNAGNLLLVLIESVLVRKDFGSGLSLALLICTLSLTHPVFPQVRSLPENADNSTEVSVALTVLPRLLEGFVGRGRDWHAHLQLPFIALQFQQTIDAQGMLTENEAEREGRRTGGRGGGLLTRH